MRAHRSACAAYLRDGFCAQIKACPLHHPNLEVATRNSKPAHATGSARSAGAAGGGSGGEPSNASAQQQAPPGIGGGPGHASGGPGGGAGGHAQSLAPQVEYRVVQEDWEARFPQRPEAPSCADFLRDGFCPCASPSLPHCGCLQL
jgi:hypothetical protein